MERNDSVWGSCGCPGSGLDVGLCGSGRLPSCVWLSCFQVVKVSASWSKSSNRFQKGPCQASALRRGWPPERRVGSTLSSARLVTRSSCFWHLHCGSSVTSGAGVVVPRSGCVSPLWQPSVTDAGLLPVPSGSPVRAPQSWVPKCPRRQCLWRPGCFLERLCRPCLLFRYVNRLELRYLLLHYPSVFPCFVRPTSIWGRICAAPVLDTEENKVTRQSSSSMQI